VDWRQRAGEHAGLDRGGRTHRRTIAYGVHHESTIPGLLRWNAFRERILGALQAKGRTVMAFVRSHGVKIYAESMSERAPDVVSGKRRKSLKARNQQLRY